MKIAKCDICDADLKTNEDCHLNYTFGYGTEHDGDTIDADICDRCMADDIVPLLKPRAITTNEGW